MLGTALVTDLLGLVIVAMMVAYFSCCATAEERNLTESFPSADPAYRASTKMLVPYVL